MPKIAYLEAKRFQRETLRLIQWADETATDYRRRGYNLTLRQLYYQGVSQNIFPNTEKSYNKLGRVVNDARLAGMIDWTHIEDRGRDSYGADMLGYEPDTDEELIERAGNSYFTDLWEDQEYRVEVWVEKQALEEVAEKGTQPFRIGYFACKGYVSQSEMWRAGVRQFKARQAGQKPLIIHIGDHDPSGIDMTRDIEDRLSLLSRGDVEVRRIALNMDQIEQYNPPPNPAKTTDSRFADYQSLYGNDSWELDALRPELLVDLIQNEVRSVMDMDKFDAKVREENSHRGIFDKLANNWTTVQDWLEELD